MLDWNKKLFVIFSIARIFLSILLIISDTHMVYKFIGLFILDSLDGNRFYDKYIYSKALVKSPLYQYQDKLNDTFIYIILFLYILLGREFAESQKAILGLLLLYRIIGTLLFLETLDRRYLFYFPNLFYDMGLVYSITNYFNLSDWNNVALIPTLLYSLTHEYFHHYINSSIEEHKN
jgi:hypothetical protein